MSEKSSEYHKKTCIICGCHTNQTINIYEPRSGPNIVRLIQARFKFQPLNDDKYLCYSCNNWLINWHSLQALNSNEAESSSSTFRSSPVNNMVPEKGSPSETGNNQISYMKPIAQIRPQIRSNKLPSPTSKSSESNLQLPKKSNRYKKIRKLKPLFSKWLSCSTRRRIKNKNRCCHRLAITRSNSSMLLTLKCKNCRRKILQRNNNNNMYLKPTSPLPRRHHLWKSISFTEKENHVNLVKGNAAHHHVAYQAPLYQRPLVDGKIVSMLRRLGTTLTRDGTSTLNAQYPPIMSPSKRKSQRWTRDIGDDEILLNFNTAITEVLPVKPRRRRRLIYHMSEDSSDTIEVGSSDDEDEEDGEDDDTKMKCEINLQKIYNLLPKGLSVSIISASESTHPAPAPVN